MCPPSAACTHVQRAAATVGIEFGLWAGRKLKLLACCSNFAAFEGMNEVSFREFIGTFFASSGRSADF